MSLTERVLAAVAQERAIQDLMWNRVPGRWLLTDSAKLVVLVEEVGEVARAIHDKESIDRLRAELVQVAAVAVCWAECLQTGEGEG